MSRLRLVPRSRRLLDVLFLADRRRALGWSSALFVAVALLDLATPAQLNLTFAYVSILIVVCWHSGAAVASGFGVAAFLVQVAGFIMTGDFFTGAYGQIVLWNRAFTFAVVIALVSALRGLHARLERSALNLRAMSRHLVSMHEAERARLARGLHDSGGQPLAGLGISLDIASSELPAHAPAALRRRLAYCKSCVDEMVEWTRSALEDLRPTVLDELGLVPALHKLVREMPLMASFSTELRIEGEPRPLDRELELAVFRILQEALLNAGKHSGARSAEVRLAYATDHLRAQVMDRGQGFTPRNPLQNARAEPRAGGFGLLIMEERAIAIGALLHVDSAPGRGTTVTLEVELPAEALARAA